MDFSVPMALVDFIPVFLFGIGALVLGKCFYYGMKSYQFACFSAGSVNIFAAGFLKATWKLLYALGVCDFEKLNAMFFPLQTLGFLLLGIGICCFVFSKKKPTLLAAAVPVTYSGTMLFVVLMILGVLGLDTALCTLSARLKKPSAIVLSIISFIFVLGMGYLSSKDFTQSYMNWAAECVNIIGQGAFLGTTLILKKAGLADYVKNK